MPKKPFVIIGSLIGIFILVNNATGSGALLNDSTKGGVNIVKALQGR